MTSPRERIALAVDLPLPEGLQAWERVAPHVGVAKVGLSLFVEHGPRAVEAFLQRGARVFLDLKLHDIPNTVELAAARAGALGVSYLTIHAGGGSAMVKAAVQGAASGAAKAGHQPPVILAVTVLTSMDDAALAELGIPSGATSHAQKLADVAVAAGATGLVCSAREVAAVRARVGPKVVLCTPGIRPVGAAANDQARTETPASAVQAGSDLLVIGRPITS
ncbi:MAG TPA: orotidine-5'-phosphate decarboxylase, partial [Archangium sp.]